MDAAMVGTLTLIALVGRDILGPGLGLGAFMLRRFVKATSPPAADVLPDTGLRLLGRAGFRAAAGFAAGGWARMVTIMGLTNMPYPMGQSK